MARHSRASVAKCGVLGGDHRRAGHVLRQLGGEGGSGEHGEANLPVGGHSLFEGHLAHPRQGFGLDPFGRRDQRQRSAGGMQAQEVAQDLAKSMRRSGDEEELGVGEVPGVGGRLDCGGQLDAGQISGIEPLLPPSAAPPRSCGPRGARDVRPRRPGGRRARSRTSPRPRMPMRRGVPFIVPLPQPAQPDRPARHPVLPTGAPFPAAAGEGSWHDRR